MPAFDSHNTFKFWSPLAAKLFPLIIDHWSSLKDSQSIKNCEVQIYGDLDSLGDIIYCGPDELKLVLTLIGESNYTNKENKE